MWNPFYSGSDTRRAWAARDQLLRQGLRQHAPSSTDGRIEHGLGCRVQPIRFYQPLASRQPLTSLWSAFGRGHYWQSWAMPHRSAPPQRHWSAPRKHHWWRAPSQGRAGWALGSIQVNSPVSHQHGLGKAIDATVTGPGDRGDWVRLRLGQHNPASTHTRGPNHHGPGRTRRWKVGGHAQGGTAQQRGCRAGGVMRWLVPALGGERRCRCPCLHVERVLASLWRRGR